MLLVAGVATLWAPAAGAQSPAQGPGGPVLVVTAPGDAFGTYYAEILRAEGLNEFAVTTTADLTASTLSSYQVVLLAQTAVSDAQALLLNGWVQAGGNLIAMRPDPRLASLLGLGADAGDVSNGYVKVATGSPPGAGISGETMQFHGTADRWSGGSAATVATLYAGPDTPTSAPAVTLRSVGSAGGQAAAFTYDLARSVVYTRQGNPDWVDDDRDGIAPLRSDDLFFGAKAGDMNADWIDFDKIEIPQADEQQRLLANLVTQMNLDRTPLPRFWYLPSAKKAAVVLTGDDHAHAGTIGQFHTYEDDSPSGCVVAAWECVRSTSYVFPGTDISPLEAQAFQNEGFEIALHYRVSGPSTGAEDCNDIDPATLSQDLGEQLGEFAGQWPNLAAPVTGRTHCIVWKGWTTEPSAELAHGIRFDTNYYYWPGTWVQDRPGMFTGSGFPMRFAEENGAPIDVYQAATQLTDESQITIREHIQTLLDNALGPKGYYGVFTANMHTDNSFSDGADAIIEEAQARGVSVVSAKQMLTWLDGRNGSSFQSLSYGAGLLRFSVARAGGALGLETMVPWSSAGGQVTAVERNGTPVAVTRRTIKGIDYATFDSPSGDYAVAYGGVAIPPPGTTTATGGATAGTATTGSTGGQTSAPSTSKTARDTKAPRVKIVNRRVRASKKGLVTLRVSCPQGEVRCRVDLRLLRGKRQLVRKTLTVAGGKSANVTLRLTRSDRLRLVRLRSLLTDAAASARDVAGNHATTTTRIRLLAPGRR